MKLAETVNEATYLICRQSVCSKTLAVSESFAFQSPVLYNSEWSQVSFAHKVLSVNKVVC